MKKIFLTLLLIVSSFMFSQKITDTMKNAFETDNPVSLIEEITFFASINSISLLMVQLLMMVSENKKSLLSNKRYKSYYD